MEATTIPDTIEVVRDTVATTVTIGEGRIRGHDLVPLHVSTHAWSIW